MVEAQPEGSTPRRRLAVVVGAAAWLLAAGPALTVQERGEEPAGAVALSGEDLAAIGALVRDFERAFGDQDLARLGSLFANEGVLHDWRGRVAGSRVEVRAAYGEGFREARSTHRVTLEDGRQVVLQRYPPVAPRVFLGWDRVRGGPDGVSIDGTWRARGVLSPSGAVVPGFERYPDGATGAFRLNLRRDGGEWKILHLAVEAPSPPPEKAAGEEPAAVDRPADSREPALVLTFSRSGGIAGRCHRLQVDTAWRAVLTTCAGDVTAQRQLSEGEQAELAGMLDRFGHLSVRGANLPLAADRLSERAELFGRGHADSEDARRAVLAFARQLLVSLR